ncbi:MAG: DUF3417 domain-containing protein, partial [Anaerolineae bacterium]|nr:DUF3417 domain-containing protein [Anaerolineae bacterium]
MNDSTKTAVQQKLTPRLARLEELTYNFWWSWHHASRNLFRQLDQQLWATTRHNPVRILLETPEENIRQKTSDPLFLRDFDAVMRELDKDIENNHRWFSRTYPDLTEHTIAYFSAEFGLHTSLPIYSGG